MIVVGVDTGATRTRVGVWRDGTYLGGREASGAAIRPGRALQASALIAATAKAALAELGLVRADRLVVGAAGAGHPTDADELRVALRGEYIAERLVVTTDVALALASLPPEVSMVLLAGTGSIALGRVRDGAHLQQGGHGWQMGDEGSGYWIGREALGAVSRAADGRGPATTLTGALLQATHSTGIRDLAGWAATASPREVASLARVVVGEAEAGDPEAGAILARATEALVLLVQRLAALMGADNRRVALGGGLLDADRRLRQAVADALSRAGFEVETAPVEPLRGALALATAT